MRMMTDKYGTSYADASDRADGMGLHSSHRWGIWSDTDCWNGMHGYIRCITCNTVPFYVCYFELPATPEQRVKMLRARGVKTELDALQPCPGRAAEASGE